MRIISHDRVDEGGELDQRSKGKTKEGVDEPVTVADQTSHLEMYTGFKMSWPDLHIVSEEVGLNRAMLI